MFIFFFSKIKTLHFRLAGTFLVSCVHILQCVVIYPFKNSSQLENKNMGLKHNVSLCKKKQTTNNLKC